MAEFVKLHDNLALTVDKGRIDENTPITVITRYSKSRPDIMILKLATIQATPAPEEEEEGGEDTSSSTHGSVNGAIPQKTNYV